MLSMKMNLSYHDFLKIPVFQRRYLINKIVEINTPLE